MGVWGIPGDKTNVTSAPNYQVSTSKNVLFFTSFVNVTHLGFISVIFIYSIKIFFF